MSSSSIGSTLIGGIQDISALLPLLGTEQCEDHVSSALTKGYLYAAATPMSIFGSLGMARAGFKALIAAISISRWKITGAQILADIGFKPQGLNLRLIMADDNDKKKYSAERALDKLLEELHIDDPNKVTISSDCTAWNIHMIGCTAALCTLGILPYVYVNVRSEGHLSHFSRWAFPSFRILGGFLTTTTIQFVIQVRISTIIKERLAAKRLAPTFEMLDGARKRFRITSADSESWAQTLDCGSRPWMLMAKIDNELKQLHPGSMHGAPPKKCNIFFASKFVPWIDTPRRLEEGKTVSTEPPGIDNSMAPADLTEYVAQLRQLKKHLEGDDSGDSSISTVFLLFLLFIGILLSVVGYVGCFSLIQSARSTTGPLFWLLLETGLSILRMILWGVNPDYDDAPPLKLNFKLETEAPLPTCNKCHEEIEEEKVLPLVRASMFLDSVTSFAGPLTLFNIPDLALYYTLTRKTVPTATDSTCRVGERVLYITIFDHKERTTRIYTQDSTGESRFYAAHTEVPRIDVEHALLEMKIGREMTPDEDPVVGNADIRNALVKHFESIINLIHSSIGHGRGLERQHVINNRWTLRTRETANAPRQGVNDGKVDEHAGRDVTAQRDLQYLEQGRLERNRRTLVKTRGDWITHYMAWVIQNMERKRKEENELDGTICHEIRTGAVVDPGKEVEQTINVEIQLIHERYQIEMLLVDEVAEWEGKLLENFRCMLSHPRQLERRLAKIWATNCWRRLDVDRYAMEARMKIAKLEANQRMDVKGAKEECQKNWDNALDKIREAWNSIILFYTSSFESLPKVSSLATSQAWRIRLAKRLEKSAGEMDNKNRQERSNGVQETPLRRKRQREMEARLNNELDDIEARLKLGLQHCNRFWASQDLVHLMHSDSKWLQLSRDKHKNLEAVTYALKQNRHVIFAIFSRNITQHDIDWTSAVIRSMTSLTSIQLTTEWSGKDLLPIVRDNLRILSICGVAKSTLDMHRDALDHNQSLLNENGTRTTTISLEGDFGYSQDAIHPVFPSSITIRFVGPQPGKRLMLRLVHGSSTPATLSAKEVPSFTWPIPCSLATEDIHLYADGVDSRASSLLFQPYAHNTLTIMIPALFMRYQIRDIQLLEENQKLYNYL